MSTEILLAIVGLALTAIAGVGVPITFGIAKWMGQTSGTLADIRVAVAGQSARIDGNTDDIADIKGALAEHERRLDDGGI